MTSLSLSFTLTLTLVIVTLLVGETTGHDNDPAGLHVITSADQLQTLRQQGDVFVKFFAPVSETLTGGFSCFIM